MIHGHELYLAIRPSLNGKQRDLAIAPESADVRVYLRQPGAWRWLDEYRDAWKSADPADPRRPPTFHPGYVLEVHLDRLFQVDRGESFDFERRYQFHERQMQEHAALAERARTDGAVSTLLDENDLATLRAAAEGWLRDPAFTGDPPQTAAELELTKVLTQLIKRGKLGGGR